jgi:hypothetical protein
MKEISREIAEDVGEDKNLNIRRCGDDYKDP